MKSWFRIEAKADDAATVFIYDEIGTWGVTASDFTRELSAVKANAITLRVNSPGGDVFDGIAIYNALREHPATVTAQVDGLAASIASIIAMAGDEIVIAKNAFFMIHNAWAFAGGGAEDMRKMADVLDKIDTTLVKTYADRTGQTQKAIRQMMADETWLTADESVMLGLADRLADEVAVKASFDLSKFKNAPKDLNKETPKERDIEKLLRDAGVSRTAAKAAVSTIKGQTQRDADEAMGEASKLLANIEITGLISRVKG